MRITNNHNLPAPLVEAVRNDKYDPGESDYTTSQLAGVPARQLALKRKHWHEMSEDAAERIYSLAGQSKHVILERAAEFCDEYEYLAEQRFYIKRQGKLIGGQIDLYDKKEQILYDWKEVSVWISRRDLKHEWVAQGNINKLLCEENGFPVMQLINIALYRDWKKAQADSAKDYPPHQVEQYPLPIWTQGETEDFIARRITAFEAARVTLPECSDDERWYSGDKYALIKRGNKKATKVFDTEAEAKNFRYGFEMNGYEIQFRAGVNKRCENYCIASTYCEQFLQLKEGSDEH